MTNPECIDCRAGGITTARPAPHPGPRCKTHARRFRAAAKVRAQESHRFRTYGVTPEECAAIMLVQDGVCPICRRANGRTRALSVDHDHAMPSGKAAVRGLLCRPCNDLLGHVRDDAFTLLRAVAYLASPPAHQVIPREDTP